MSNDALDGSVKADVQVIAGVSGDEQAQKITNEKLLAASQPPPPESVADVMKEIKRTDDKDAAKYYLDLTDQPAEFCDRQPVSPYFTGAPLKDNCGMPIQKLYDSVKNSVAQAMIRQPGIGLRFGSSFKLCDDETKQCFFFTNNHVTHDADYVGLADATGKMFQFQKVLARDKENDIALLESPPGDTRTSVVVGALPKRGDPAFTVGHPLGYPQDIIASGYVYSNRSAADVEYPDKSVIHFKNVIESDVFAQDGNSGGAEFNKLGQVTGIKTVALDQGGSVSVPISRAVDLMKKFEHPTE